MTNMSKNPDFLSTSDERVKSGAMTNPTPVQAASAVEREEWRGTKAQREALRQMFGGRCAYCGNELGAKMHADHVEPCLRVTGDQWSRPIKPYLYKPERNVVSNMMPACAPCNLHKGGYSLEQWRAYLQRSAAIVRKQTSTFRAGERFGVITVNERPVRFYFETLAEGLPDAG